MLRQVLPLSSIYNPNLREYITTHVQERLDVPAEARDRTAGGQEREDGVRAVRAAVQVPGVAGDAEVRRDGHGLPVRAVLRGDRARVEVGEPDHDFVLFFPVRRGGREEIVGHVGDD